MNNCSLQQKAPRENIKTHVKQLHRSVCFDCGFGLKVKRRPWFKTEMMLNAFFIQNCADLQGMNVISVRQDEARQTIRETKLEALS